jgi:glycosyltransferase involved in cell wall biosynthesis
MKVALVNNRPQKTGTGRYAFTLFDQMKEQGVTHYFIDQENNRLERFFGNSSYIEKEFAYSHFRDNQIFLKLRLNKIILDSQAVGRIPRDYDIYHFTNQVVSNSVIKVNLHGKKIITVHDLFQEKGLETILPRRITFPGIKHGDMFITISNYSKNELKKYFGISDEKIKVIYEAVDPSFRPLNQDQLTSVYDHLSISPDNYLLLHIGKPLQRKNDALLIKILHNLIEKRHMSNITLIKVGDFSKEALNLLHKYHLENSVIRVPMLDEENLIKLYNISNVFLFPSFSEGFGFPALEAMACGTPVIASNRTAIPEIVGDAGILIDPTDTEGFVEGILSILNGESLAKLYSKRGIKRAKMFSWESNAKATMALYESIV